MKKKRWGIFSFYDEQGKADQYVFFYLKEMNKLLDRLIIVCNGSLDANSYKMFEKMSKDIVIRKNVGGDGGAYKDILLNYIKFNELQQVDELVFFNDTVFGPFGNLEDIFRKMETEQIDFWGITENHDIYLPPHIQSFFLVIKNKMLCSKFFSQYWNQVELCTTDIRLIIANFEIGFTCFFEKKGYKWKTVVGKTREYLYENPCYFLKEKSIPFIKKKSFGLNGMDRKNYENVIGYISTDTHYSMEYIRNSIDRKYPRNVFNGYFLERVNEKITPLSNFYEILEVANRYKRILIYGDTLYGLILAKYIGESAEFIVSDLYYKEDKFDKFKITKYSQVEDEGDMCVIVTLSKMSARSLKQNMKFKNVIFYW